MKARTIRKLRKKIAAFKTFIVMESQGIFGNFPPFSPENFRRVKATNQRQAIYRYMQWYYRHNKQKSDNDQALYAETTCKWGKICVIDSKGYHKYYH